MEKEIEMINKIIVEAVMHGADSGGSYDSNEKNLIGTMKDWLEFKGLSNKYGVEKNSEVVTRYRTILIVPQIVPNDYDLSWLENLS